MKDAIGIGVAVLALAFVVAAIGYFAGQAEPQCRVDDRLSGGKIFYRAQANDRRYYAARYFDDRNEAIAYCNAMLEKLK